MSCIYSYKGHTFKSDLELSNFLILKEPLYSLYGDVVYSISDKAALVMGVLVLKLRDAKLVREEIFKEGREVSPDSDNINDDIGKVSKYIGVNKFLSSIVNDDGSYMFPIFIAEEFWKRKFEQWKNGEFTPEEQQTIFEGGLVSAITDNSQLNHWKNIYTEKWQSQADIGSEIHKVLLFCFRSYSVNRNHSLADMTSATIKDSKYNYIFKHLSDELIDDVMKYAKDLNDRLQKKFGPIQHYYTEYIVTGKATGKGENRDDVDIMGMIDLMAIDERGNCHIIDYKTSPKDYSVKATMEDPNPLNGFSAAKVSAFKYLLNVYKKLLAGYGIRTAETRLLVAPIQLLNFKKDDKDKWNYNGLKPYADVIDDLSDEAESMTNIDVKLNNIYEFYEPDIINVAEENIPETILKLFNEMFPGILLDSNGYDKDELAKDVAEKAKQDYSGMWTYKQENNSKIVYSAETKEKLLNKIYLSLDKLLFNRSNYMNNIVNKFHEAVLNNASEFDFTSRGDKPGENLDITWINDQLKPYLNGNWELMEDSNVSIMAKTLGILLFKNDLTGVVDAVVISPRHPKYTKLIVKGRKYLNGYFKTDALLEQEQRNLMLQSTYGNMEMIRTMLFLNCAPDLFKKQDGSSRYLFGGIKVLNPHYCSGLDANNELLLYSFNKLAKAINMEHNYFASLDIKVLTNYLKFRNRAKEIYANLNSTASKEFKVKSAISDLDNINCNTDRFLSALIALRQTMENTYPSLKVSTEVRSNESTSFVELYNLLLFAITEGNGFIMKLLLIDHDKYIQDSLKNSLLHTGVTGTYTDNPGTTPSDLLNEVTKWVTRAYQNIRDDMGKVTPEIRRLVEDYKKEKNFGYFKEKLGGNPTSLYRDMYREVNGDLNFVNPYDPSNNLGTAGRKLLVYCMTLMYKNRHPEVSEHLLHELFKDETSDIYKVPLLKANFMSRMSVKGLLSTTKYHLDRIFHISAMKKDFYNSIDGLMAYSPTYEKDRESIWLMCNRFDISSGQTRLDIINLLGTKDIAGIDNIERNLELLTLSHTFAYSQAKHINKILPNIKASVTYLKTLELLLNSHFKNDIKYIEDYVTSKVLHRPIDAEKWRGAELWIYKLMKFASFQALAFSPVLLYQGVEGLWKDISLLIRKPDGKDTFSKKNMIDSFMYTYKDLAHFGNLKSKTELINEDFALNDMDMNMYVNRLHSDRTGLWHFWSDLAFRMSSRPDYYNRMTILGALMRNDGSWDAYTVKDNRLVYDWKLDKRFNAYAKGLKDDPEYNIQKGRYLAMAKLLVIEGATNPDGSLFKVGDPLPKAYSADQIEGYKSFSNLLYGYYSHENKSLIQSTGIGALFFLMYTYMSGKKNLWLGPSRISLYLDFKQYEEDGVKYYIKENEDGTWEPTTENTGVPYMVYQGAFLEGIILTLVKCLKEVRDAHFSIPKSAENIKKNIWDYGDENNTVRIAYRLNLRLLLTDVVMFTIIGGIVSSTMNLAIKDYEKENDIGGPSDTFNRVALNYAGNMAKKSIMDFNPVDSIAGRFDDWNPFAISIITNSVTGIYKAITGSNTVTRALLGLFAGTKVWKPTWDYYIPMEKKDDTNE